MMMTTSSCCFLLPRLIKRPGIRFGFGFQTPPSPLHHLIPSLNYQCWSEDYSDNDDDNFFRDNSDSDSDSYPKRILKKRNIFRNVDPDGVQSHLSLMEEFPELVVPIKYKPKKNKVKFDQHRCSIVDWYKARLSFSSKHHGDDNGLWSEYISESTMSILKAIFGFLRCRFSLPSDGYGHFLEHMWIDRHTEGYFYLPFQLTTSSVDDLKMDSQVVSNFIHVVYNKRPLKEMENLSSIVTAAGRWLDTTPMFLKNLSQFLPTFDPNKHCVEVTFNPPYFWSSYNVRTLVSRFAAYAYEANHAYILNRLMTEMGFTWVDKLPEKGNIIRDLFDEFGGSDTYKENIDIFKFYQDVKKWRDSKKWSVKLNKVDVFEEFDSHFGLLWILYRLCTEFFRSYYHQNMNGSRREYLLCWLGFVLPQLADPISGYPREVFDVRRRSPILQWYKDKLYSKHHDKDNEHWFDYIAESGFHILHTIFGFLSCSISSGVSLSSDINGPFINHMWIDENGEGLLYLPFHLTSSVDNTKMDLQVVSNFIYVVFNKRPLKEMENLSTIVTADHRWLDTTPGFLHNLYRFLPTFDPNKHCVEVMFDPPYLWNYHDFVLCFADRFAIYACDEANKNADILDRLMTEMGYTWLDKVPDKGDIIRDWFDELGGSDTYKENIDLLKFFKDAIPRWGNEHVFEEFDFRFGLLWIQYRLCTEYFHSSCYPNTTTGNRWKSKKDLLDWLGFNNRYV